MAEFVHLHVHDQYSMLDGICKTTEMVQKAKALGYKALAQTNHGNVDGVVKFYKECKRQDVKPIVGCELYVVDKFEKVKGLKRYHTLALAKNFAGFQNIMRALTVANQEQFYHRPLLTWEQVLGLEDVVIMSACVSGVLSHPNFVDLVKKFKKRFGQDFFLETQPMLNWKPQTEVFKKALEISKRVGIPIVATNDIHYLNEDQNTAHEAALCIGQHAFMDDARNKKPRWKFDVTGLYMKTSAEMRETLVAEGCPQKLADQMLENSLQPADRCNFEIPKMLVSLPMPKRFAHIKKPAEKILSDLAYAGLDKMGKSGENKYRERLQHELNEVCSLGFPVYFLVLTDLIWWCREHNLMVGPGRGSVGGSLLAWCLEITSVDSVAWNLSFERFISPGRIDLPDIDVDFQDDRREEIISYLRKQYGEENVAQVRTFNEMHGRQALRDASRVFSVSNEEASRAAKAIIKRSGGDAREDYSIEDAFSLFEECKEFKRKYPKVVKVAQALEGIIRQGGIHAAGVVVSKETLYDGKRCVVINAKDNVRSVNWDKRDLDDFGLMKLDVLGLSTLTVLCRAKELIMENHAVDVVYENIPLDDQKVLENFRKGNTIGVFQFGTTGLSVYCREVGIEDFNRLVDVNALWRPGTLKSGMTTEYCEIKNQHKAVTSVSEFYDKLTADTFGIMLYQEQIMQVLYQGAGIGWRTVDTIRKVISKSEGTAKLASFKKEFMDGCALRETMSEEEASAVFDKMVFFGSYGFNRSHAVAYTMLGYWTMWLKVYYPTEFYCSLINFATIDKRTEYVDDARKNGVKVLLPDINFSDKNWKIDGLNTLRAGLNSVSSVSDRSANEIIRARASKWIDLESFLKAVPRRVVNKRVVQNLGRAGALRSLCVGVLSSQNIDEVFGGKFELDPDDEAEAVLRLVGDVVDFSPSSDPLYRISALVRRVKKRIELQTVKSVLNKELAGGSEANFIGRIDKIKYGYRDRITKDATSRGFADDLGGAYCNFFDGTSHIMLTFDPNLTHKGENITYKKRIEAAEDCWVLLRTSVMATRHGRDIKLLVRKLTFLEELTGEVDLAFLPMLPLGKREDNPCRLFEEELADCTACSLRQSCRAPVPPSIGKFDAMVIAEAPGEREDKAGSGLVGRSGSVLWNALAERKILRPYLYVNNVVKCRPPDNKLSNISYAHKCGQLWLDREIRAVNPLVVLVMGGTAADFFTRDAKITELCGKVIWNSKYECWVVYCLHPAATLYEPSKRAEFLKAIDKFAALLVRLYK